MEVRLTDVVTPKFLLEDRFTREQYIDHCPFPDSREVYRQHQGFNGNEWDYLFFQWRKALVDLVHFKASDHSLANFFDFPEVLEMTIEGLDFSSPEFQYNLHTYIHQGGYKKGSEAEIKATGILFLMARAGLRVFPCSDFIKQEGINDPDDPRLIEFLHQSHMDAQNIKDLPDISGLNA